MTILEKLYTWEMGKVMKIHKMVNNNIVIALDASGKEQIYIGRGIGFKKHAGDEFDENAVEKKFSLSTEKTGQLEQLLREIPMEEIDAAVLIMNTAITRLGKKLNEGIILALSDHIHTSIVRSKQGIYVKNVLLWEIKKFYREEYQLGKQALEIIKEKTGVQLTDDEAGFIALHIVNAQMDEAVGDMYGLTKVMQEIVNIVKYTNKVRFDEESIYYYRFITHLKFFAQRLMTHTTYNSDGNDKLLEVVKEQYASSFSCVEKITEFILNNYNYALSSEEQLYLTIHIEQVVNKSTK